MYVNNMYMYVYNMYMYMYVYVCIRVGQKLGVMHQPQKFVIAESQIDAPT